MSTASQFLNSLYSSKRLGHKDLKSEILLPTEASSLAAALLNDATSYYFSSAVTFTCGITSLRYNQYSWATVHFYYSLFYSLRSWLAEDALCLFYYENKPFTLEAKSIRSPCRENGPSHDIITKIFSKRFSNDALVTGSIDIFPALDWIKNKREELNYRTERFSDPKIPTHFSRLRSYQLRRLVQSYVDDDSYQWQFDPDHATIALPLSTLIRVRKRLKDNGLDVDISDTERAFFRRNCSDSDGAMPLLLRSLELL